MSDTYDTHTPQDKLELPMATGEENLPTGTIVWIGLGSLALFAAGIFVAYLLLVNDTLRATIRGSVEVPPALQQHEAEMGIVDQHQFELEHREKDQRRANLERLSSYGWADKEKKAVHIPIEEAMKQVLAEQKR